VSQKKLPRTHNKRRYARFENNASTEFHIILIDSKMMGLKTDIYKIVYKNLKERDYFGVPITYERIILKLAKLWIGFSRLRDTSVTRSCEFP
jgi:hypothetical protein